MANTITVIDSFATEYSKEVLAPIAGNVTDITDADEFHGKQLCDVTIEDDVQGIGYKFQDLDKVELTSRYSEGTMLLPSEKVGVSYNLAATDPIESAITAIEAGTYVIPYANQTSQTTKTAWVQAAVTALIPTGNPTVAVVTYSSGYVVTLTWLDLEDTADITVTLAPDPRIAIQAAAEAAIEAGTYAIPLAEQNSAETKTTWVQAAVDALIPEGNVTTAVVPSVTDAGTYAVALETSGLVGEANISITLADA